MHGTPWQILGLKMDEFLINIYIPFKDIKGIRQRRFLTDSESVLTDLEKRVGDLKKEVQTLFGDKLQIAIVGRSDGGALAYYWRYRSTQKDRKFRRLANQDWKDYIGTLDKTRLGALRTIEDELIYMNANVKLIKAMRDAIAKSNSEHDELYQVR
jgi:hypothetical protein